MSSESDEDSEEESEVDEMHDDLPMLQGFQSMSCTRHSAGRQRWTNKKIQIVTEFAERYQR